MAGTRTLTAEEKAELDALRGRPDREIDLTDPDSPEVTNWAGAIRGVLYRPVKLPVTMRIDADVLAWFKSHFEKGYQTKINAALRAYVEAEEHQRIK